MKIYYREKEEEIEIVRVSGSDPQVEIPDRICEKPVTRTAPYAFSSRKSAEDEDVMVWESEEDRLFGQNDFLLAGEKIRSIRFPDTMKEIGKYVFYGCRNLEQLCFSDRLMNIGSGAFTGCRSLCRLDVELTKGDRTCVREILGDLWQRIDVTFHIQNREIRLVFPEHYEEAVENTPARILFTQHHGSGNNYRQCFYDKRVDFRKYDSLFYLARAQDQNSVITDLIFARLMYPEDLTEEARRGYEEYIREHVRESAEYLTDTGNMDALREIAARGLWGKEALSDVIEYAARTGQTGILSYLMNERHRLFPEKRHRYEL